MYNNSSIRAGAWSITKANLGKLFGIMFAIMLVPVLIIVPFVVLSVTSVGGMGSLAGLLLVYLAILLVMPAITMGLVRMLFNLHRSGELRFADMFYYITDIKRYGKAFLLMLIIGLISIVCNIIPILGQILCVWLTFRLMLATWLFVSDERLSVIECIKFSFELMKGHCWRMFCMMFVMWLIAAGVVLLCMIPFMAISVMSESVFIVFLMIPLMLAGYAVLMPFIGLSVAGFAAELMPATADAPAEPRSTSPEL